MWNESFLDFNQTFIDGHWEICGRAVKSVALSLSIAGVSKVDSSGAEKSTDAGLKSLVNI